MSRIFNNVVLTVVTLTAVGCTSDAAEPVQTPLVQPPQPCSAFGSVLQPRDQLSRAADIPPPTAGDDLVFNVANNGLELEPTLVMPPLPDADGDMVPDIADECGGGPPFRAPCGGVQGHYFDLPYLGGVEFTTEMAPIQVPPVDVYFLIDRSDSMAGAHSNLAASLTTGTFDTCPAAAGTGILGAFQCSFPDVRFGVGVFGDYDAPLVGNTDNLPYHHLLDMTVNIAAASQILDNLTTDVNISSPESLTQALYATVTGNGLGDFVAPRAACPGTGYGYPCFDPARQPIIVTFTDAEMHEGPPIIPGVLWENEYSFTQAATAMVPNQPIDPFATNQATAQLITAGAGISTALTGDLGGFSNDVDAGCQAGVGDARVEFVGDGSPMTIHTRVSGYDTVLNLFDGVSFVACNDNTALGRNDQNSQITGSFTGTHLLVIDGDDTPPASNDSEGLFRVVFDQGGPTVMTVAAPVEWPSVIAAVNAVGAKVLAVESCGIGAGCVPVVQQADDLGIATGSVDGLGAPYVQSIPDTGIGLDMGLVTGVQEIAAGERYDLDLVARDNAGTAGVDERDFVESIVLSSCPALCSPGGSGTACQGCPASETPQYQINLRNDVVMPTMVPQLFELTIDVLQDGVVTSTIPIRILVPAEVNSYIGPLSYEETYDATSRCLIPPNLPHWYDFEWDVLTPSDSQVVFEIWTADSAANLATAPSMIFAVPGPMTPPLDLSGVDFLANGMRPDLAFVRVRATLYASSTTFESPTLRGFEIKWICEPSE